MDTSSNVNRLGLEPLILATRAIQARSRGDRLHVRGASHHSCSCSSSRSSRAGAYGPCLELDRWRRPGDGARVGELRSFAPVSTELATTRARRSACRHGPTTTRPLTRPAPKIRSRRDVHAPALNATVRRRRHDLPGAAPPIRVARNRARMFNLETGRSLTASRPATSPRQPRFRRDAAPSSRRAGPRVSARSGSSSWLRLRRRPR